MSHLILVRHGQSEWNLENKFTGWVDVELAPQGKLEACKAGEFIKKLNLEIKHFYTSYQLRSIDTLKLILNTIRVKPNNICLLYTSPSPRDLYRSRMPSSA